MDKVRQFLRQVIVECNRPRMDLHPHRTLAIFIAIGISFTILMYISKQIEDRAELNARLIPRHISVQTPPVVTTPEAVVLNPVNSYVLNRLRCGVQDSSMEQQELNFFHFTTLDQALLIHRFCQNFNIDQRYLFMYISLSDNFGDLNGNLLFQNINNLSAQHKLSEKEIVTLLIRENKSNIVSVTRCKTVGDLIHYFKPFLTENAFTSAGYQKNHMLTGYAGIGTSTKDHSIRSEILPNKDTQ